MTSLLYSRICVLQHITVDPIIVFTGPVAMYSLGVGGVQLVRWKRSVYRGIFKIDFDVDSELIRGGFQHIKEARRLLVGILQGTTIYQILGQYLLKKPAFDAFFDAYDRERLR